MELQGKSFSVLDMNFVSVSSFLAVFPFLHLGVEIITLGDCFFCLFAFWFFLEGYNLFIILQG